MKITKYEHACLLVEDEGKKLVIDPGNFSASLGVPENVVAIVITHAHMDHLDKTYLEQLLNANPAAKIFSTESVATELTDNPVTVVRAGDEQQIEPFLLHFFGGQHALIHESIPRAENIGVMVNNTLYYPGDSLVKPDSKSVPVLALPINAPWMRIGEAMDFLTAIKPRRVFPTHDSLMSADGYGIHDRLVGGLAASIGSEYIHLEPGQSIDT